MEITLLGCFFKPIWNKSPSCNPGKYQSLLFNLVQFQVNNIKTRVNKWKRNSDAELPSALNINLSRKCGITRRVSNSSHRKLALLFITYFPIFPSALTSTALFKCNYPPANLQEKKNNDFRPEEQLLVAWDWCGARALSAFEQRDDSHRSFVLAQRGVNKMCGFMSSREKLSEWKSDMFQNFFERRVKIWHFCCWTF